MTNNKLILFKINKTIIPAFKKKIKEALQSISISIKIIIIQKMILKYLTENQ